MQFKLTATEREDTGELGWLDSRIPLGSEIFEPLEYECGLAHDCLEHFAFEHVGDEIEAHGAMYWTRYEGGWCNPRFGYTLDMQSFAHEWINLYEGLQRNGFLPTPRNTRPLDSAIEEDISRIIEMGKKVIRNEADAGGWLEPEEIEHQIECIASVFRAYFRTGYRKAMRRFKGRNACEIAWLYNELADVFKRNQPEHEGEEITVSINLKTCKIKVAQRLA